MQNGMLQSRALSDQSNQEQLEPIFDSHDQDSFDRNSSEEGDDHSEY
jgi:hypothetical protein